MRAIASVLGVAAVAVWFLLRRRGADPEVAARVDADVRAARRAGAVGAVQYQLELPAEIVWIHVALAACLWLALLWAVAAAGRLAPVREVAPSASRRWHAELSAVMLRLITAWLAVVAAAAGSAPAAARAASELPAGFEDLPLVTGLRQPTAVSWAPDGRMFVAEKEGRVRVVMPDGRLRPTPLLDISEHVNAYWDRGLTDVAVAPDFAQSGRLYLLYDADRDPVDPEGPKAARLTHVTVLPDGTVADSHDPETVVLGGTGATCPARSVRRATACRSTGRFTARGR